MPAGRFRPGSVSRFTLLAQLAGLVAACDSSTESDTHRLIVSAEGIGSGAILSTPTGIDCLSSRGVLTGECRAFFPRGVAVTLSVTTEESSAFTGWSGSCNGTGNCLLTMSAARRVNATFEVGHVLSVVPGGSGSGLVEIVGPAGVLTCGGSGGSPSGVCSSTFPLGTVLQLTATAGPGSVLGVWTGPCAGSADFCAIQMNLPLSIGVNFDLSASPGSAIRRSRSSTGP